MNQYDTASMYILWNVRQQTHRNYEREKNMGNYWDERALKEYLYKGEKYYTITPIPYYYERRKVILKLLKNHIVKNKANTICDYGCGDGEYIKKLYNIHDTKWSGYDISKEMINHASRDCVGVDLNIASDGIPSDKKYDLIYTIAVLAHIDDAMVKKILSNFSSHLNKEGAIILCEQVGKRRVDGETYTRRMVTEYEDILESLNLVIEQQYLIDFWLHRIVFERNIAKKIYSHIEGETYHDKQITANSMLSFKILSKFFTILSKPHTFKRRKGWGYMFLIARKREDIWFIKLEFRKE